MNQNNTEATSRTAGFFLYQDRKYILKTHTIPQSMGVKSGNRLIVPAGTVYPSNDSNAIGLLYEDVDVTNDSEAGSVVVLGTIDSEKVNVTPEAAEAMKAKRMRFLPDIEQRKKRVEFTLKGKSYVGEKIQMGGSITESLTILYIPFDLTIAFAEYSGNEMTDSGEVEIQWDRASGEHATESISQVFYLKNEKLAEFSKEEYERIAQNNLLKREVANEGDIGSIKNVIGYYKGRTTLEEPTIPYAGEHTPSEKSFEVIDEKLNGEYKAIFTEQ